MEVLFGEKILVINQENLAIARLIHVTEGSVRATVRDIELVGEPYQVDLRPATKKDRKRAMDVTAESSLIKWVGVVVSP